MTRKNDIVEVIWYDIEHDPSWQDEKDSATPPKYKYKTVGYYTKRDKKFIYLSSMVSHKSRDKITIPKGCIESITTLTKG